MKCLSVDIPYATLLVLGAKRWHTRTWVLPRTVIGERVGIATTRRFGYEEATQCRRPHIRPHLTRVGIRTAPVFSGLAPSAVVGTVRFVRCLPALAVLDMLREQGARDEEKMGWYRNGWWAWEAEDPEMFDTPIPATGHRRFWRWEGPHG